MIYEVMTGRQCPAAKPLVVLKNLKTNKPNVCLHTVGRNTRTLRQPKQITIKDELFLPMDVFI